LEFGANVRSYLLINDGTGKFTDQADRYSSSLKDAGFVTGAIWTDINYDNRKDLVVCSEWGTIDAYVNTGARLERKFICNRKGWWNFHFTH
jgi:hypothetical protein